jgi:translation initiation factor IF-1
MSGDVMALEGIVKTVGRSDLYIVSVVIAGVEHSVKARRAGILALRHLSLLAGDKVIVELSPYDMARGRITRRLDDRAGAA